MGAQGMPEWLVSLLKWSLTVAAMVLLVSYAAPRAWTELQNSISFDMGRNSNELPQADPAEIQPHEVQDGRVVASADVAVSRGALIGRTAESVMLGYDSADQILVGFEPIPTDTACLTEVILEAFLIESTDHSIYVRPAALAELATAEDGQILPGDAIIEGTTPASATATGGTSGWLAWDVLGPYTLAHRTAPDGALVVLSIAVPADDPERWSVLGTTDSTEDWAPRLRWKAVTGPCEIGRAEPDASGTPAAAQSAGSQEG